MPDSTLATLANIQTKVRRLTRSLSQAQLSDADLNNYINTFLLYDFPEHLRTFNYLQTFTFYCQPGQDIYPTNTQAFAGVTTNPLYNFQNVYLTVQPPFYIAGQQAFFTQSREQFYNIFPLINALTQCQSVGGSQIIGDGHTTFFTGIIQPPGTSPAGVNFLGTVLLQNNVVITSIDLNGNGLAMHDVPVVDTTFGNNNSIEGNLQPPMPAYQNPYPNPPTVPDPTNNIDYQTGIFNVTFPTPPANGQAINAAVVYTQPTLPTAVCYFDNEFILRPVPDQAYPIQFQAFIRPTELMNQTDIPDLAEYWQWIAYGASKKIFEDRMDLESVQMILPEYKKQELLMLRRTLVQQTNQRSPTIYTENLAGSTNGGWFGNSGNF